MCQTHQRNTHIYIYRFETSTIQKLFTWNNIIWPVYTPGGCVNRKPLTPKMLDFENQRAWKFHQCWIAPESCFPQQFVIFLEIHRDKNYGNPPNFQAVSPVAKVAKRWKQCLLIANSLHFLGFKMVQHPISIDKVLMIGSDWVVGMLLVFKGDIAVNCSKNSPLVLYVINNPC